MFTYSNFCMFDKQFFSFAFILKFAQNCSKRKHDSFKGFNKQKQSISKVNNEMEKKEVYNNSFDKMFSKILFSFFIFDKI